MIEDEDKLSPDEIAQLRALLEAEQRMIWLRSSLRVWGAWVAGVLIAGFALWKAVTEFISIKIGVK